MATAYPITRLDRDRWVSERRIEPRAKLEIDKPVSFHLETEPDKDLVPRSTGVIFLANKECPWRCVMCDLWQHTFENSVPAGAIPRQIDFALSRFEGKPYQIKLYNSGSFFDTAAIPREDNEKIANKLQFAERVIIESHPALIGHKVTPFQEMLRGKLEIALGLETAHAEALNKVNKGLTLETFARACDFLRRHNVGIRVFLLINPPFVPPAERHKWVEHSIQYAFEQGADVISLIITRGENGPMRALEAEGEFSKAGVEELELAHLAGIQMRKGLVFADSWDIDKFVKCSKCVPAVRFRFDSMNLLQKEMPKVVCTHEAEV